MTLMTMTYSELQTSKLAEQNKFNPNIISFSSIRNNKKRKSASNNVSETDLKTKIVNARNIAQKELTELNKKFQTFLESIEDNNTANFIGYIETIEKYHEMLRMTAEAIINGNEGLKEYFGDDQYNEIRKEFYRDLITAIDKKNNTENEDN